MRKKYNISHIKKFILFIVAFLFVITMPGFSQRFKFNEYTVKQGLAQPYVYSITQDTNGYLWIGTGNGLCKFDGINFKTYTTNDSLADNFITCSFRDKNDIWFGHMNGQISHYNGNFFSKIPVLKNKTSITDIERSPDGQIWAGTFTNGIIKIDENIDNEKQRISDNQIPIYSFKFLPDHKLLIGSVNGLNVCRMNVSGEIEIIRHLSIIPQAKVVDIIKRRNNPGYYIATENEGIFLLIQQGKKFQASPVKTDVILGIQSIYEDSRLNLWVSTFGNGLIKLNKNEKTTFNLSGGFSSDYVKIAFEDREGNIWSGNYGSGLTSIIENKFLFYCFDESLYGKNILSIISVNKSIWLGTEKGILIINEGTGEVEKFYSSDKGLPQDEITAIFHLNKDIWIGTEKNGIYRMSIENEKITLFKIANGILENSITSITGSGDHLWIGTKKGICHYNLSVNAMEWYTMEKGGLPHNYINYLFIDSKGTLWASMRGIYLAYIKDGRTGKIMINSEKGILSLGPIAEDSDSTLWVGSSGSGLFKIKSDKIFNITSNEGLVSDYCYSVISDGNKNIWVGHKGGLSRVNTSNYAVKPLQNSFGINTHSKFNINAVFKDVKNRILFGSDDGLLVYEAENEKIPSISPVLNITSIKVNNEEVDYTKKIVLSPGNYKIRIDYLGINLKEPDLVTYQYQLEGYDLAPEITKSTYVVYPKLSDGSYTFVLRASSGEGVITNPLALKVVIITPVWKNIWFYIFTSLIVISAIVLLIKWRDYNHLLEKKKLEEKVQDRTLEIREKNYMLEENQKEIVRQNTELENYRSHLERLVDDRTKELMAAKIKAEESDTLKSSFLNNLSHEIRTPLNAICGFSQFLEADLPAETKHEYIKIINRSSESLLFMMDEIMDISLLNANQLIFIKEKFIICDVLNELEKNYIKNNSKELQIEFKDKSQNKKTLIYTDKKRFNQVFNHFLHNAEKFTESGKITFGFSSDEGFIKFFIADTGIGMDKSEIEKIFTPFYKIEKDANKLYRGTGIGLAICKKLVELMGGEIWVESEKGKGSTFYFTLPASDEQLNPELKEIPKEFEKDFLKKVTILIAEDDPEDYRLISVILRSYGAEIKWAQNGEEAIDFVKKDPALRNLVILMDIKMPVMDGFEAREQIRLINKNIPVIALYQYKNKDKQRIQEVFNDSVLKPIKIESLLYSISKFLNI